MKIVGFREIVVRAPPRTFIQCLQVVGACEHYGMNINMADLHVTQNLKAIHLRHLDIKKQKVK
jgi:hypothetical protein